MSMSLEAPIVTAIFLCAMAFENASKGLILSIQKFGQSKTPVPAIMIVANILSLAFGPMYIWSILAKTDCQDSSLAFKVVMHLFFTSFSFFLLYKTWIVSQKRTLVAVGAVILILNRAAWTVLDWMWSKSEETKFGCHYIQDKTAIVGISTGGIAVDIFCTGATIISAFRDVDDDASSKMQRIYRVLIADNVLRTLSVMAVNAFTLNYAMYSNLSIVPGNPTIMVVIPAISNFVYTQAINIEFFWINVRNDILKTPEHENELEREHIRMTSVQIRYDDHDNEKRSPVFPPRNH
ncbi:hypothetical protein HDU77_007892 [Chytriomyces hyalinus]|nr:hypothetical protein HDU77_007892 [Chytriomyces hyalinus]